MTRIWDDRNWREPGTRPPNWAIVADNFGRCSNSHCTRHGKQAAANCECRRSGWRPAINDDERNSRAALIDYPPATTMRDVVRMTCGPIWRAVLRHGRAMVTAVQAYKEQVK